MKVLRGIRKSAKNWGTAFKDRPFSGLIKPEPKTEKGGVVKKKENPKGRGSASPSTGVGGGAHFLFRRQSSNFRRSWKAGSRFLQS